MSALVATWPRIRDVASRLNVALFVVALLAFCSLFLGIATVYAPYLAGFLVVVLFIGVAAARFGLLGVTLVLVGSLPWLEVLADLLPSLLQTFVAATGAAAFACLARRGSSEVRQSGLIFAGLFLLLVPMVISLALAETSDPYVQAAKYLIFFVMVVAVAHADRSEDTRLVAKAALYSAGGALALHLGLGLSGVGKIGTKYGTGEILGLTDAHHVALIASCTAAAALGSSIRLSVRVSVFAVAAAVTIASGVRSALVGLFVATIAALLIARVRRSGLLIVAVAAVTVVATGAIDVTRDRYEISEQTREFETFEQAGSGRGAIWKNSVDHFLKQGPLEWTIGTGLRSIPRFSEEDLGSRFVGHSDVVEVGVQLGAVGLLGLILLWVALVRGATARIPLVALGTFAVLNGALEYSAPLVLALVLAMGARPRQQEAAPTPSEAGGVPEGVDPARLRLA